MFTFASLEKYLPPTLAFYWYKILFINMYKVHTVSISERLKWKDNQILILKSSNRALDSAYKECHNRGVSWEGDNNDTD